MNNNSHFIKIWDYYIYYNRGGVKVMRGRKMGRPVINNFGSGVLNPGAVFLRFVTEVFLLFLAPTGPIF